MMKKKIFALIEPAIKLCNSGMKPEQIFISEKLQKDAESDIVGLYENEKDRIIILRSQLSEKEKFLGTLIHELTHADSGWSDVCRQFEHALTTRIGFLASKLLN